MRRVGELLRPLWVRLVTVAIVLAVTASLVVAFGRPSLFSAANTSAANSQRGYHCHPHTTGNGACKPNHCC